MKLTVIIPAYNEERIIGATLEDLVTRHAPDEVLVVDGGSTDGTVNAASRWAGVMHSGKGRAGQMNAGARQAGGDIFLFLHADTRLPAGGLAKIRETIRQGRVAGRFRMQFDDPSWVLRLYASYTRFQVCSYGDQGFFVRRAEFERLGGFREDAAFEDIDFYQRLRRITRPVILREPVTTSARRFARVGSLKQRFLNLFLVGLYYAGFDVSPLKKKLYADVR